MGNGLHKTTGGMRGLLNEGIAPYQSLGIDNYI
jgi:hypothetical protein